MSILTSVMILGASLSATPVILDTDLGDDIDDTWALCQMLAMPEIDLKLIVTASDNTPEKTKLVAKILDAVGRTDIPLATGIQTTEKELNHGAWAEGFSLRDYKGKVISDGVQAIIDTIRASDEKIVLCVIGPQTNIGAAVEMAPDIAEKAEIVSMAGSVFVGYEGKPEPQPEWNVMRDVPAIRKVFAAPWKITLAPLDICGTLQLKGDRYKKVAESEHPFAKTTIANYDQWVHRKNFQQESSILFDTVAVHLCVTDKWIKMKEVPLSIDDAGKTVVDNEKGRPVQCAVEWTDREAYEEMLVKLLTEEGKKE